MTLEGRFTQSIHYARWNSYKSAGENLIREPKSLRDYLGAAVEDALSMATPLAEKRNANFLNESPDTVFMPKSYAANQEYHFKARPQKVFEALTEPKSLVKWFLSKAKIDPETGGTFTFDWIGGYRMVSKLKKYEEDKAVTFSWIDKLRTREIARTTALFEVKKQGKGTLLKLRHSGFKDPEHFADCSSRWAYYLTNMKSVLDYGRDLRSEYDW